MKFATGCFGQRGLGYIGCMKDEFEYDVAFSFTAQDEALATQLRKASSSPRKSGHAIAKAADVPLKDFVFWMVVFRDHGWMSEDVVQGEHLYANREAYLRGHANLGEDMKELLGIFE